MLNDLLQQAQTLEWWLYGAGGLVVLLLIFLLTRRGGSAKKDAKASETKDPVVPKDPVVKRAPVKTAKTRIRRASGTTPPPPAPPHVLILASEPHATNLCESIALRTVRVKNAAELISVATKHKPVAAFVDVALIPELEGKVAGLAIVGVLDAPPAETLHKTVEVLGKYPSVAHVLVAPLLTAPLGRSQLKSLLERLAGGPEHDLLGAASVGRVAMLAQSARREARFARMQEYFSKQGMSARTISAIYEVAEELVMNALYNAPTEAGYFKTPVSRADDVTLPIDRACEVSYGIEAGTAFVRVRDTFGALRHPRLLEVLTRCNTNEVTLDESRGGAGLGMWRVFSAATTLAITVIPGRLTDILVRMAPKQGKSAKQLLAVDLYFLPDTETVPDALKLDQDSGLFENSITIIQN